MANEETEKKETYCISLFNPGCDIPVAKYSGVLDFQVSPIGRLIFTRRSGQQVTSSLGYIVEVE